MMDAIVEKYVEQVRLVRRLFAEGYHDLDPICRSASRKAVSYGKQMTMDQWEQADDMLWTDEHDPYELIYDTSK